MEVGVQLHSYRCIPGERAPGTRWIGDWVGTRAGLDAVLKGKYPVPAGNLTPVVQLVV
jgi:hypothetical protein